MTTYTIKRGDTLYLVARKHDISYNQLMQMNPQIRNANRLSVGQAINVPSATTSSQAATTTAVKAENVPAANATENVPAAANDPENVSPNPNVASQTAPAEIDSDDAPWFDIAVQEKGVKEIRGRVDNPRIVEYHQTTTFRATDDETPWCSAFVNWCMQQADIKGTNSASSRSWRNWGERLREPRKGCIVCFNGHVGFYDSDRGRKIMILGGNQSNQVNIIPYSKSRVLTYRWPD